MDLIEIIKEDIFRYIPSKTQEQCYSWKKVVQTILNNESLWMVILYRFGRWANTAQNISIAKHAFRIIYSILSRPLSLLYGIHIPWTADIGPGFYIGHYGGIWIGPVTIGRHCNISHEVTIGLGGEGDFRGMPQIGNNVYIGPGAKIFGKIRIGNNIAIGANSVVSKSLPDNCVVVGNPGRIVSNMVNNMDVFKLLDGE